MYFQAVQVTSYMWFSCQEHRIAALARCEESTGEQLQLAVKKSEVWDGLPCIKMESQEAPSSPGMPGTEQSGK